MKDAVCASVTKDAVTALFAQEAVPNREPVYPPSEETLPESIKLPETISEELTSSLSMLAEST